MSPISEIRDKLTRAVYRVGISSSYFEEIIINYNLNSYLYVLLHHMKTS